MGASKSKESSSNSHLKIIFLIGGGDVDMSMSSRKTIKDSKRSAYIIMNSCD